MTLIVEDGSLTTDSANTYATQSYVATYCSDHGLAEWAALASASLEEQAIHRGMAYIESMSYKGYKCEEEQPLKWPREEAEDEDGYVIDSDVIPPTLLRGLARASYEEAVVPGILQSTLTRDDFTISEKVDVIAVTYERGRNERIFRAIDAYLVSIMKSETVLARV